MTTREQFEARLAELEHKIATLEAYLAIPDAPRALEATIEPIWTERINLDSTVKEGWRPKECTVTVQNAGGDAQTREERRRRIAEAIEDGQAVADALNSQRDQVKRFA